MVWGGLSYRFKDALSVLIGYEYNRKIFFGYSYDIGRLRTSGVIIPEHTKSCSVTVLSILSDCDRQVELRVA